MIDFGFDKIALISAVALIVIGPEKLPRVARPVGHLIGKASGQCLHQLVNKSASVRARGRPATARSGMVERADFGREREARRHRQADRGHFGEVRALTPQQFL